jgi:ABC-type molybdate transport system ATPase subunit
LWHATGCHQRIGLNSFATVFLDARLQTLGRRRTPVQWGCGASRLLRARHEFSPTMIWIEHDIQLVRDLADKVLVLHYGKELAFGSPDQVLSDPEVIEAYIRKH